jgi:uncharacterized membrane protein
LSAAVETLTIAALVGAGLNAGVFFSFSTFTMQGLHRLAPTAGAAAMQEINREAPKPPLMLLMFGTAAVTVALMVQAAGNLDETASVYQMIASGLFLIGVIVMTGVYHVPRNNRLDRLDANSPEGSAYWAVYLREWVRMNHVRTVAPLVAAVLLALSLTA